MWAANRMGKYKVDKAFAKYDLGPKKTPQQMEAERKAEAKAKKREDKEVSRCIALEVELPAARQRPLRELPPNEERLTACRIAPLRVPESAGGSRHASGGAARTQRGRAHSGALALQALVRRRPAAAVPRHPLSDQRICSLGSCRVCIRACDLLVCAAPAAVAAAAAAR